VFKNQKSKYLKTGVQMSQTSIKNKVQFYSYRLSTILKSLKALYTLPREKVDAFIKSYEIYDYDWENEEELISKMGADYYKNVKSKLIDWYTVINHLCAIGQVEKMYIPPAMDLSKGIIANQVLFEEMMARDLCIPKEGKVLDIGCGRGRVASHIARLTGAHVTGINIDHGQLECARRFVLGKNLTEQTEFKIADLNDFPLPFADSSLDAVYHVQVFSLCKNFDKMFEELYRIIKPGGHFACLDWVRLDKFDPKNLEHTEIMRRIKPLVGAIGTRSIEEYVRPMEKAGFKVRINKNASIDGLQAPLIENADRLYTTMGRIIKILVGCKLLPRHFKELFDRLSQDGEAFIEADRKRLVTTSHYIVAQK
jgi:sterol 24-C-methyltransferase